MPDTTAFAAAIRRAQEEKAISSSGLHLSAIQEVRDHLGRDLSPEVAEALIITLYTPDPRVAELLESDIFTESSELYTIASPDQKNLVCIRVDWPCADRRDDAPSIYYYENLTDASGSLRGYAPGAYDPLLDPDQITPEKVLEVLLRGL